MNEFYVYLSAVGAQWLAFMVSGPLILDELIRWISPPTRKWLDSAIKPGLRRRIEVVLMLLGVFYAGFLAFRGEHQARLAAEHSLAAQVPTTCTTNSEPPIAPDSPALTAIPSASDLAKLSNDDLRALTYAVYAQLDDLVKAKYRAEDGFNEQAALTAAQKGENRLALDQNLSREFRLKYEDGVVRLYQEVSRRITGKFVEPVEFPSDGIITSGAISSAADSLQYDAREMP